MLAIQKPSQEQSTLHIILKSLDQVTTMNKFKRINNDFMNMLFYIGTYSILLIWKVICLHLESFKLFCLKYLSRKIRLRFSIVKTIINIRAFKIIIYLGLFFSKKKDPLYSCTPWFEYAMETYLNAHTGSRIKMLRVKKIY